jgi:hypothetical protein
MTIIHDWSGKAIRRGRSLRIIMEHARGYRPRDVHTLSQQGKVLHVHYADGAKCTTVFADEAVLGDWIAARVRYGRGRWKSGKNCDCVVQS